MADKAPKNRATSVGRRELQSTAASRLESMTPQGLVNLLRKASRGDVYDYACYCDRMQWFDGHIKANLDTRTAMVGAAPWEITPGTSRDEKRQAQAQAGADFASEVLRDLDVFEGAVMKLLGGGVGVGWGVVEKVWDSVDGVEVPVDLAWLHPRRFRFGEGWEIRLVDDGENWVPEGVEMDPERFIVHTPSISGSYPGVAGVLRACAWPYLFRRWATQFWVRGVEKFAWPTLQGTVKRDAGKEVRAEMAAALQNAADDHYIVNEEGQQVAYLETLVKDAGSFAALDEALKSEISKSILGSTDQTEPVKVGAWKAVESRKGTTVDSRVAVDAYQIERTLRAQLLEPLMRFNAPFFGGVIPPTPEITFRVSGTVAPLSQQAINSGSVTADEVREREGLPAWGGARGAAIAQAGAPGPSPAGPTVPAPQAKRPSARRKP